MRAASIGMHAYAAASIGKAAAPMISKRLNRNTHRAEMVRLRCTWNNVTSGFAEKRLPVLAREIYVVLPIRLFHRLTACAVLVCVYPHGAALKPFPRMIGFDHPL